MKGKKIFIIITVILIISLSVIQIAGATEGAPGSEQDPLTTKSYVDKAIQGVTTFIEEQINPINNKLNEIQSVLVSINGNLQNINNKLSTLEQKVDQLENQIADDSNSEETNNDNADNQPQEPVLKKYAKVTAAALNVRSGPSTSYSRVTLIYINQEYEVIEQSGVWYKIQIGNKQGWVHGNYVEILEK